MSAAAFAILISVVVFLGVAAAVIALWPDETKRVMREHLESTVGKSNEPMLLKRLGQIMTPIHKLLPLDGYENWMQKKQLESGLRMPPLHFLVLQEVGLAFGLFAYFQMNVVKGDVNLVWWMIWGLAGMFFPILWLDGQIKSRKDTFARDLPEIVDLLALCVGAGADFMSAMARIVREFRACPAREELGIMLSEVRVGKRRVDALRSLQHRVNSMDMASFCRTLIQADRMGTGLMDALNVLSEDMRLERYNWAERYAQKAPMKMMLPLVISLGSCMIVIAAPIMIKFMRGDIFGM